MHQSFDQQHMLAGNGQFVAKENLKQWRFALLALLVDRLDKGARDRNIDRPHQIAMKRKLFSRIPSATTVRPR